MKTFPQIRLPATIALLAAAAIMLGSGPARADLELTLNDGLGNSVTLDATTSSTSHTGSGVINSFSFSPAGSITVSASLGVWFLNVTTGLSKPIQGTTTSPGMDLNSVDRSSGAGTLTISFTDTGWGPASAGTTFTQDIGGTLPSGWSLGATLNSDPGNASFGTAGVSTGLSFMSPPIAFSGTSTTPGIPMAYSLYSLTLTDVIHATSAATVSFDHNLSAGVPEPSTMAIAGLSALGLIGYGLRGRKVLGA